MGRGMGEVQKPGKVRDTFIGLSEDGERIYSKTMKSYHILKTAGDYAKQFAEIVNPAEERLLYIINVCPFLSFEGKVFLFMNG